MVGPQHPLPDGQGTLEEWPGGGQLTLGVEQDTEVVEALGGVGMVGSQDPLPDGQGTLEPRPGRPEIAGVLQRPTGRCAELGSQPLVACARARRARHVDQVRNDRPSADPVR